MSRRGGALARSIVALLAFQLVVASAAWGQPAQPSPDPPSEQRGEAAPPDPVIVEGGTQVVRPPPEPQVPALADPYTPGARTRISREAFADTQRTVADVLEQAPGVTVTRGGDGLSSTRVSIRGSRSDQVLILLDGVPLAAAADAPAQRRAEGRAGVDLAAIPLERVESIEIVRGAASSLYGPGAAAGAILIRTRRAAQPRLEASVTFGSDDHREGDVLWSAPLGAAGEPDAAQSTLTLHANQRRASGRYVFFDPDAAKADPTLPANPCALALGDGLFERRCNAARTTTVEADWRAGADRRVALLAERLTREGLGGVENPRPFGRELRDRLRLRYDDALALTAPLEDPPGAARVPGTAPRLNWRATAEQLDAEREENPLVPEAGLRGAFTDQRLGGEVRVERWLGRQRLEAGAAAERQLLDDLYFSAARSSAALFAGWEAHGVERTLEASLRHDALSDVAGETTWRAGARQHLGVAWGLKASHGTGFRPPTLYERYDPGAFGDVSVANPELQAERSTSTDLGPFFTWGDALTVELLAFRQETRAQIVAIPAPASPNQFRFENVNRTRSTGLEASASWRGPLGLSADAAWTEQEALILDNAAVDPRDEGNRVPGVPERRWSLALAWRQAGWHGWYAARHSGLRWVDAANTRFLQPYTLHDAGLTVPLSAGWAVSLEGRNLGNATYAELDNFPPPGRQWLLTLRWRDAAP